MAENSSFSESRRSFLRQSGALAVGTSVLGSALPAVHAGEDNTIRLALIGCGPRGTGAVANALNTAEKQGPIEIYAMADLAKPPMLAAAEALKREYPKQVNVPEERMVAGWDAYKTAIDMLRPGDVALCTTRAYIRPVHVEYAVKKGVNVFMEKPFSPDAGGLKRLHAAGQLAEETGSKIAAGLQCRHSPARQALIQKIEDGAIGDISYIRANRLTSRRWMGSQGERSNDLVAQLGFGKVNLMWVGSGHMVDYLIHQIDECCWLMGEWPEKCHGFGGREVGSTDRSQNLDVYSMEFTFPSGRRALCGFRRAKEGYQDFATFVHGTKKAAQFSGNVHAATVHIFKDQKIGRRNIEWSPTDDAMSPWDYEWANLIDCIRNDKPLNECPRAVNADYATLMGRAACHLNREVTWDEITGSNFQFCDHLEQLTFDSQPPALADAEGFFALPGVDNWQEI